VVVIDTADHKKIDFMVEYLLEFIVKCKKALSPWVRGTDGVVDENNWRLKIS
jgi:hypothetical protein